MALWGFPSKQSGQKVIEAALRGGRIDATRNEDRTGLRGSANFAANMCMGVITTTNGAASHARRYAAKALHSDLITVGLPGATAKPLYRPCDETGDIEVGAVNDLCVLMRTRDSATAFSWKLGFVLAERIDGAACSNNASIGSGILGTTGVEETAFGIDHLLRLALTQAGHAVTTGNANKISRQIFSFAEGVISIDWFFIALNAYAASATNTLRASIGTAAATGSGTTLTGTEADVVPQFDVGVLAASPGVNYTGFDHPALELDGRSTPVSLYLNMCPSANWNANDTIYVGQRASATDFLRLRTSYMGDA